MPYNPGIEPRGGEYIMRGIEMAGQAIARGIGDIQARNKEERELDGIAPYFLKDRPDDMQRYQKASLAQKRGIIAAEHYRTAQQQRDMDNYFQQDAVNRDWYRLKQDDQAWAPSSEEQNAIAAAGYRYAPTSKRSGTYVNTRPKPEEPALGSDPTGTGRYLWNGSTLVERSDAKQKAQEKKQLTGEMTTRLSSLFAAQEALPKLKEAYDKIASKAGPVMGRLKNAVGATEYDPEIKDLETAITGFIPLWARGVKGDVGVLTDKDTANYRQQLPGITHDPEVAGKLYETRHKDVEDAIRSTLASYDAAGFDVSGFAKSHAGQPGVAQAGGGTSNFQAGKVYQDAQGRKRRYNADGTWTKL